MGLALLMTPNENLLCSTRRLGEGNGTPLQYSCLENPMDGGAWWAAVHGVAKSRTRLRDFTFTFHFHALEKEMATHSSVLAWRIPWTEEPGGLPVYGVAQSWTRLKQLSSSSSIPILVRVFFFLIMSGCWILSCFFFTCWNDHVVFAFPFVTVVYQIGWFAYVEPCLWSWNESNLIVAYEPYYVLLNLVC